MDQSKLTGMGAEPGFEADDMVEPARVSGFFSLFFGLASVISFMGSPLLVLPILAIGLGLLALRRCDGKPPLGTGPAKVGLVLAIGFGIFGAMVPYLKTRTLGEQAKQFSLQYLNLIAQGDDFLAQELQRPAPSRLPPTMSLPDFYESNPDAKKRLETFHIMPINTVIRRYEPGADWQLDRPVVVDYHFGREQVEVVWRGPTGGEQIQFFMEFQYDANGVGQWHVETVQRYRERIVAEKVL